MGRPVIHNAGYDHLCNTCSATAAQPAAANYLALTANNTPPAAGDTTLTAEIATAGGGLIRAQAAYAHTPGTKVFTLVKTFTANGSDALPVTVTKFGVFNAASAGTMFASNQITAAAFAASGDAMALTETVTFS